MPEGAASYLRGSRARKAGRLPVARVPTGCRDCRYAVCSSMTDLHALAFMTRRPTDGAQNSKRGQLPAEVFLIAWLAIATRGHVLRQFPACWLAVIQ